MSTQAKGSFSGRAEAGAGSPVSGRLVAGWALRAVRWLGLGLGIAAGIVLAGGLLGAGLFVAVGLLFGLDYPVGFLARKGALNGAQYAGIWAGGLAIVACAILGHRRHQRAEEAAEYADADRS